MNKDEHLTSVGEYRILQEPTEPVYWKAQCDCGWIGPPWDTPDEAFNDAQAHRQDMHERAIEAAERMER